jgi:hypothetical protein
MEKNMVRLSFDIPVNEHIVLKTECAQMQVAIKDFLQELVLNGIHELKEKQLQARLKKSIKQSKEGKVKSRGSFAKYAK